MLRTKKKLTGGRGTTGRRYHLTSNINNSYKLPSIQHYAKLGQVITFWQQANNKIYAQIKNQMGWQYLLPAVRGQSVGQFINQKSPTAGSYWPVRWLKHKQVVSNIVLPGRDKPTLICAPGTFARLSKTGKQPVLQLPNKQCIVIPSTSLAQLGANAGHNNRHTKWGGAGPKRRAGYHPHTRMKAKNPHKRTSLRYRLKKYNYNPNGL